VIPAPADGMFQRGRGLAVEKRQAPVIEVTVAGTTPPPRSKEGTHPGRISHVRNTGTPTESGPLLRSGRPTARNGGILWREQDAQEANAGGRKPTGNHNDRGCSSKEPLLGNWPDTGQEVRPGPERGADVGR
jgi:hypothetical protein